MPSTGIDIRKMDDVLGNAIATVSIQFFAYSKASKLLAGYGFFDGCVHMVGYTIIVDAALKTL